MAEYDVKVTPLYGDTYRVEAYPSARPVIFGFLALLGFGLVVHLMKEYGLSFNQAVGVIIGGAITLMVTAVGLFIWLKPKFDRLFDDRRW